MDDPGPSSTYYRSFASTADGPIHPPSPPHSPLLSATVPSQSHERDLYGLLNLSRESSDSQIRDRYRSLATTFHPDRQRNDHDRLIAHSQFTEIQRAYEILIDPTKRTIYDLFGEEGLKTSWEIGPKHKSPEELKRFFISQKNEKRSMEIESFIKPKSDIELVLDSRAVFLPRSFWKDPSIAKHDLVSRLGRVRTGRIVMKHSFEAPLSDKTQLVIEGQAMTRNGRGGANVLGTIKHQFSPRLWIELSTSALQPRVGRLKGTWTIDEDQYITWNIVQQTLGSPPQVGVTLGRRLYSDSTGFISYESGSYAIGPWGAQTPLSIPSSLSVGITNTKRDGSGWTIQTTAGLASSRIATDWSTKIPGGVKLKFGVEAGLNSSPALFINAEGKLTENVRGGIILQCEIGGGIIMKFKMNRLGQRISLPVLLSERLSPTILFFSTIIPAATYMGAYRYVILPRKKRRLRERIQELREENKDFIGQKKAEALDAVSLMEREIEKKVKAERDRNGLIIVSAQYGLSSSFTSRGIKESEKDEEEIIDVTVPIQALVQDGKLYIPGGKGKFNIIGFWDPCIGENKSLRVRYLFRGVLHQVTIEDTTALRIPVKAHALEDA
ncbi:uncharacterized protein IL334_005230 [Kwoniella shivajii]|uniref:J domain-containing protein n=1 Tax=Kwoniella shivajii TaxID=564305 RepID=A0ABZ1D4I7_9TREE|nr:hypothetical protein IL334_005230 [Kwoniella shivajii]